MLSKMDRMSHNYKVPVSSAARPNPFSPPAPSAPGNDSPQPTVGTGYVPVGDVIAFESDDTGNQGNAGSGDAIADDADVNRTTVKTEGYAGAISGAGMGQPFTASPGNSENTKKLVIVGIAVLGLYLIMK